MLGSAPLCLLFLGPLAKGRPGLLGVATLQLGLENADPHPNPKFNDSCCKRVQPLSLISPAGIEIGFITAAARMFCCTPTTSRTKLILLRNESCNDSAVGNLVHSEHSKPTFDKDEQAEEFAARPLASAKAAAGDVSKVSAAVQTHTPQPDMRIEALTDTDSGRHVHQASVGLQTEEYSVPSQQAALQEPQASAALVLQSPHFHLYPPAAATAPPPPLPLQAAPQEAAQAAAVINISQPSFHLHPLVLPPAHTHTDAQQQVSIAAVAVPTAAESETVTAAGEPESVSPAAECETMQQAAEQQSMLQPPPAAAATEAGASNDFDSWCPVTAVPYPSACTAPVTGGNRLSARIVSGVLAEADVPGQQSQVCGGAHVALQRQPQRCRHCEGQGHSRPGSPARQHHMRPMSRLRHSSYAEGDNLTVSEGSKSGKTCQVGGSTRDVAIGGSCRDVIAGGSGDREVIATQQQASDSQQQLVPLSVSAEAGNVSEASREQLQAWGRSGLSKATMLMRLQEALADVEQLKADLLITEDPAWQPAQSVAAPEKKRKAQRLIQHPALRHSQGQSSKLKANVALTRGHGDSAG
ncbi:TPA: hypothetical protein ACH3X1_003057 [Trebouxia sp. C0004]